MFSSRFNVLLNRPGYLLHTPGAICVTIRPGCIAIHNDFEWLRDRQQLKDCTMMKSVYGHTRTSSDSSICHDTCRWCKHFTGTFFFFFLYTKIIFQWSLFFLLNDRKRAKTFGHRGASNTTNNNLLPSLTTEGSIWVHGATRSITETPTSPPNSDIKDEITEARWSIFLTESTHNHYTTSGEGLFNLSTPHLPHFLLEVYSATLIRWIQTSSIVWN